MHGNRNIYLWQVDQDLHALIRAHMCDVAEVCRPRDEPRLPLTACNDKKTF